MRPTLRPPCCTTTSRVAHVVGRALEPEPRAQVQRRNDLAAREHHAVHERRGVGHRRDLLHHLDVRDLAAAHRVRRAGHGKQDERLAARGDRHEPASAALRGVARADDAGQVEDEHHPAVAQVGRARDARRP